MWFITKKILDYVCNEDIPKEKRIKVIKNYKVRIIDELIKLNPEDLIKLLFNSKVLRELKLIICEEIDKLSIEYGDSSKKTIKVLIEEFKKLNIYKDKYLLSNTCPNVFKK